MRTDDARLSAPGGGPEPDYRSLEQAAEWFAVLHAGPAGDGERDEWRRWHDRSAANRRAWQHVVSVSRRFERLQQTDGGREAAMTALDAARGLALTRRQTLKGIVLLLGCGGAGWATWRYTALPDMAVAWTADYSTGVGEVREIELQDGTQVWLNTASALNADYRMSARQLRLLAGEMLVRTAADTAGRPFVVTTRQGRLEALGTRFTVRQEDTASHLAVYQGAVRVQPDGTADTRVIRAGEQTRFTQDAIAAPAVADPAREAWSGGVLLADDIPLGELIAELRRYRHGHLGVAPEAAGLRVMGAYPLHDTERVLGMLEDALPVRVRRRLPWWVTIERR